MIKTKVECDKGGLDRLILGVHKATSKEGRVGYYSDQEHPESRQPLSLVAYYNTFGSPGGLIPERPFMQDGAEDSSLEVGQKLARAWKHVLRGKSADKALRDSAEIVSKYFTNVIKNNSYEPNTYYTIKKKGEGKPPLTHTKHLATAARVSVEKKDG